MSFLSDRCRFFNSQKLRYNTFSEASCDSDNINHTYHIIISLLIFYLSDRRDKALLAG